MTGISRGVMKERNDCITPSSHSSSPLLPIDGVDFNSSMSGELLFPPGSTIGDVQCLTINLLPDLLLEVDENFVLELFTTDPAVTVPESADIAVFTINDVLDPRGKYTTCNCVFS